MNKILIYFIFLLMLVCSHSYADQLPLTLFPLNNYDQNISTWIKPDDRQYDKRLLNSHQLKKRLDNYYDHYFGSKSPWNSSYINLIFQQMAPNDIKTIEQTIINEFTNTGKPDNKIGYGENFRAYGPDWIQKIMDNIYLSQLQGLNYQANQRAIVIENLHARALPTEDVYFYHYSIAGEGYPFDNLQMSALWAGTPVYIIAETRDHAWAFVVTPDYIAWVKTSGLAKVDPQFIRTWSRAARSKLAAITRTKTSIIDTDGQYLLSAYIGSIFPVSNESSSIELMIPVADENKNAMIKKAIVSVDDAAIMPWPMTKRHFSHILNSMIGRPYGWGGLYFYNDCSAELKSLLTPFGIWLPRHSSDQVTEGRMVDMSAASAEERLTYLMQNGLPFLTVVYIGGHTFLYLGNFTHPQYSTPIAMTYQNIWGLRPASSNSRTVIGQSVLFPLLLSYPEDTSLISLANKTYFQVSFLDQLPEVGIQEIGIDLKSLMAVKGD